MHDLLLAFDAWLPPLMRLFFVGMAALGLVGALEKLTRHRWGLVLGVPIARLDEDYPGTIGNPREVDLDPHLYDVGSVEWVTDSRALLSPLRGNMDMYASVGTRRKSMSELVCVGDLRIDASPGSIRFRTRVLVRIVPLLGALLFIVSAYVPAPWGLGWPLPGGEKPLLMTLWPLLLPGGAFAFSAVRARTGVITAHHVVTGAFMATLRPVEPTEPEPQTQLER